MARRSQATVAAQQRQLTKMAAQIAEAEALMSDALRARNEEIRALRHTKTESSILYWHQLGRLVLDVLEHAEQYKGTDDTSGIQLLEQANPTQKREMRKAQAFARTYSEEDMRELMNLRNPETGFRLTWGHISYLLTLDTEVLRSRYAAEAISKMWSAEALHDAIKRRENRDASHGRAHVTPSTISAQIFQMLKLCRQWVAKEENVWNGETSSIFQNIENASSTALANEQIAQLAEIEELLAQMAIALPVLQPKVAEAKRCVTDRLAAVAETELETELETEPETEPAAAMAPPSVTPGFEPGLRPRGVRKFAVVNTVPEEAPVDSAKQE